MSQTAEIVRGTIILVLGVAAVLAFIIYTVRKSDEPAAMVLKWVITGGMLYVLFGIVGPMVGKGGYGGAFVGIPLTAVCGLVFAIIWRHEIAGLIARPFGSLYDGGSTPPEPRPLYSMARAKQKNGFYLESIALIREQLSRFPTDVEGQLLMAEIQAQDLKDLPAAELTIQHFCSQPGHAPKNIAFALYSMADWHLSIAQDRDAARASLEKIIELLPDTEFALGASQRIAHLASPEMLVRGLDPEKKQLKEGARRIGLLKKDQQPQAPEVDVAAVAAEYVSHLEQHPLDCEVRERLAVIYAHHYHRLDLAVDQLEQMIQIPNQPAKNIVRWLNLMADLQVREGADLEDVQATLQRIIDRGPNLAAADMARNRLALLKLEFKAVETNESVKMGSYDQNLGLKSARRLGPQAKETKPTAADSAASEPES